MLPGFTLDEIDGAFHRHQRVLDNVRLTDVNDSDQLPCEAVVVRNRIDDVRQDPNEERHVRCVGEVRGRRRPVHDGNGVENRRVRLKQNVVPTAVVGDQDEVVAPVHGSPV